MGKIEFIIKEGVPQFACSLCSNCKSKFGKSLGKIKDRGCCWYFPKFNLIDIQKMIHEEKGLLVLDRILKLPNVKIYNYYIHTKGYFEEESYKKYLNTEEGYNDDIKDKTIYFRSCPFVEGGKGCTLEAKYRSYVCNFFICDEISKELEEHSEYKNYIKERDSYIRWLEWENTSLELMLRDKGINLINNFDEVIKLLKEIPIDNYDLINLPSIN